VAVSIYIASACKGKKWKLEEESSQNFEDFIDNDRHQQQQQQQQQQRQHHREENKTKNQHRSD